MSQQKIIQRLATIEAYADQLKMMATSLRKDLVRVSGSAPSGVKKKGLSDEQIAKVLTKRLKSTLSV